MLDTRDKPFYWEFKNTYELGAQWTVVKGSFTTDYCNKAVIHFYSRPPGFGSHKGNNGTHYGIVTVTAVNQYSQVVYSTSKTLWNWLGGDAQHNAIKDEDIINMNFSEPVKITYEWNLDLGGFVAHCYGGRSWVSAVKYLHMTINCNLTTSGMQGLRIVKKDYEAFFPFRDVAVSNKYLTFEKGNFRKFIDLSTNSNLTSHPNVNIVKNGVKYYLQNRYFNSQNGVSGSVTNKVYKPSRPITYSTSVVVQNYRKYKVSINGNFDAMSLFDHNNNSWDSISYFRGNFSMPVRPINSGGKHGGHYHPSGVSIPNGFDMSYPAKTMNGEINLTGNISDIGFSDKQLFYRQMTNSIGDGTAVIFKVFGRRSNDNLVISYGWWVTGYDERCTGFISSSIKIGVATYE